MNARASRDVFFFNKIESNKVVWLVVSTNPIKKYARQIGRNLPQVRVKIKNKLKPPPSSVTSVDASEIRLFTWDGAKT